MEFRGDSDIKPKGDIVFQIIDWETYDESYEDYSSEEEDEEDYNKNYNEKYTIRVYGVNKNGRSISVKFKNFKPYFFILVPKRMNNSDIYSMIYNVKRNFGKYKNSFVKYKIFKRKKFRGFENNKNHKFVKLVFHSEKSMRVCKWIMENKCNRKFEFYESNIDPKLRFIHIKNIKPGGWIKIKKGAYEPVEYPETRCQMEIETDWKNVESMDMNIIAPLIIASFDIEADSSHGDFPMAKKDYQKLAYDIVYKISKLSRGKIMSGINNQDINIRTIEDIDNIATSQERFQELCIIHLIVYVKTLITYAFYNINKVYNLNYDFDNSSLTDDISKIFTKKDKKPILEEIFHDELFEEDITNIISYINIVTSVKNTKKFRDTVKYFKERCIQKNMNINKLEEVVKSKSKSDNSNKKCKFEYYYKDILCKLVKREYLVKELNKVLKRTFLHISIEGDKVIQIGTTCNRFGEKDCFIKHIVTLDTCDDIEGAIVETYQTEEEVILAWRRFINKLDPDIIVGYNIFGFDFKYIYYRAEELGIIDEFSQLSRKIDYTCDLKKTKLASSALGDNELYYIDTTGIVLIDLLKVVQRDHKLNSYKLDYVAQHFTGDKKDDITPKQIFEYQKRDSYHRYLIAKYCIQDCALCNHLTSKLNVISNNLGMANVCSVPFSYLFLRGQGIKIFSLIAKECREYNFLLPVLEKPKNKKKELSLEDNSDDSEEEEERVGYEGAIVLDPKPDIYFDPISVLDYSSLYPSSMISENLSHDTYCIDEKWLGDKGAIKLKKLGYDYVDIKYNEYKDIDPKNKNKGKIIIGEKVCRYVQYPNNEKGVIPKILMKLLKARKETRAKIKTTEDEFQKQVLDGYQQAFKVTANSLYGQLGSRTSDVRWIDIAASTTAVGRDKVMFAKKFVEDNVDDAEVVYGDSVPGDEPILIKDKYGIRIIEIKNFVRESKYKPYEGFKSWESNRRKKQQYKPSRKIYIWVDNKWVKIKRLIRHMTSKRIFRVSDECGRFVDVTEDHSLIINRNDERTLVKPTEIHYKDKLISTIPSGKFFKDKIYFKKIVNRINKNTHKGIMSRSKVEMSYNYIAYKTEGKCVYGHETVDSNFNIRKNKYNLQVVKRNYRRDSRITSYFLRNTYPNEYVYDIETESGVFSAGIGCITLKNTDSIFINWNLKDENNKKLEGKEALQKSIDMGLRVEKMVQSHLKEPHKLEYEKTFWPYMLLSKKRYVGNKYEFDINKFSQKSMGCVLKRRDNPDIVKDVYGGVIDIIMNEKNIEKSKVFLKDILFDLINGKVPLEKLVVSKSLKGNYKNPESIAHKVLADRMSERDPGNKPQTNDRIPYVYINVKETKGKKILQGERIETPQYILDNNLTPDYKIYITNQIMKPMLQVFSLVMDEPEVLFKEVLRVATNRKNKSQEITKWFKVKK